MHTHIHYAGRIPGERTGLTADQIVEEMDRIGIDMSVVSPIESPEVTSSICMTETVIEAAERFPQRLIPFIHVDPRTPRCIDVIEHLYQSCELVGGFGETVDGLPIDHDRHRLIYSKCSELGLPVMFYGSSYSNFDDVGLPGLEACLQEFQDLIFIARGPRWWNAISADDDGSCRYPDGEVIRGGAADRLLQEYDNIYADISGGSGHNALTRDPEFTPGFITRNWRKLLFSTDYLSEGQRRPQIAWIRETPMDEDHRAAIADGNARRILKLDE